MYNSATPLVRSTLSKISSSFPKDIILGSVHPHRRNIHTFIHPSYPETSHTSRLPQIQTHTRKTRRGACSRHKTSWIAWRGFRREGSWVLQLGAEGFVIFILRTMPAGTVTKFTILKRHYWTKDTRFILSIWIRDYAVVIDFNHCSVSHNHTPARPSIEQDMLFQAFRMDNLYDYRHCQ